MLLRLQVENVALAERVELEPGPGLTILTGETGAGKSLMVDALSLLQGARGAVEFIRTGAATAVIEATFCIADAARLAELAERGIEPDGDEIIVRRVLSREGRHRTFVNGSQIPSGVAGELLGDLLEIHGQHEQQSLLRPAEHLRLLDAAAGLTGDAEAYRERYDRLRSLLAEEAELETRTREREQRIDFLRYQIDEIERVRPRAGEWDELEGERRRLENAEKLAAVCNEGETVLYSEESSVSDRVKSLSRRLAEAARWDARFGAWAGEAEELAIRAQELARSLEDYGRHVESDGARLNDINERLDALAHLRRKYGELEDLEAELERMRAELRNLENQGDRAQSVAREREAAEGEVRKRAAALTKARKAAAPRFAAQLTEALRPLGMQEAVVEWRISVDETAGPSGFDAAELLLSANRGEPARPLHKVASGGELSRVMLALHTVSLEAGGPACVVFDEIDAGIGGEVGDAIGRALRRVASRVQVLCVTHLPQIAVYAHAHYIVRKRVAGERTVSEIASPAADERLAELGRMLGGRDDDASRNHARAMLERAAG